MIIYTTVICFNNVDFVENKNLCREMDEGDFHCYKLVGRELFTYNEAQAHCNADGSYLIRINSPFEFSFVKEILRKGAL